MESITRINRLEPYFKIAQDEAKKSECVRRQYGALIVSEKPEIIYRTAANSRVSKCCGGNICARNRFNIESGRNVEVGAEIHAEIATLITWIASDFSDSSRLWNSKFILVGFDKGKELLGKTCYPCHACALAIKFAGFRYVYMFNEDRAITPYSISRIIAERELEWEPAD